MTEWLSSFTQKFDVANLSSLMYAFVLSGVVSAVTKRTINRASDFIDSMDVDGLKTRNPYHE